MSFVVPSSCLRIAACLSAALLLLTCAGRAEVVITEFLALNTLGLRDDDGDREDWIELHNTSDRPVPLAGWHLTDRADDPRQWTFPDVTIPPRGFLVVFASGKNRRDPGRTLHTNFRLSGDGEYLALIRPDLSPATEFAPQYPPQVSDVSHGLETRWSWIPLLPAGANARLHVPTEDIPDWADPSFDDAGWAPVVTGLGWDDSSALAEWIASDVASLMRGKNSSAFLRVSFVAPGTDLIDQLELRVRYNDGFILRLNGGLVAERNAPPADDPDEGRWPWNAAASAPRTPSESAEPEVIPLDHARDRLVAGTNVLAIQLLNAAPGDADLLFAPELHARIPEVTSSARYFSTPSPGVLNDPGSATPGPLIIEVTATPNPPAPDEDIVITARLRPTLHPIASVELRSRVMYRPESRHAMTDDGQGADAVANDQVWTAIIPAGSAAPDEMVRWAILARDTENHTSRWPPYPDPFRSPQYDGTVIRGTAAASSRLPVLHWFTGNPAGAETDAGARGSLYFEGAFYDNINANAHGQSTRAFPKKSYDFDFHPGHNFRWRTGQPRVDDFNLLTTWADKSHLRNILAYETYARAGVPAHFALPVRVHLNGQFHSVANLVENGDENFLERVGLDPNGALYKMYNSAESISDAEKKSRKREGPADLAALVSGFGSGTSATRAAFLFDNLDVPQVVNYLATRTLTADADCCHKNYYLYRDSDGSGEWMALPWDVDLSFGRVWTCGTPCYAYYDETIYTNSGLFVGENNRIFSAVYSNPETRQMYFRRLRTLAEEIMQPPGTPPAEDYWRRRTTELRDLIAPDAALDLAKWGTWGRRETITQAVDRIHTEFLPARRQYLLRDLVRPGFLPEAQPEDVQIDLVEAVAAPGGNPLHEYLTITNRNAFAVDISDWQLDGAVQFRFKPGTVLAARGFAHVSPNRREFRRRPASPRGGETRLVLGDYSGELSTRGGVVSLHDRRGRLVSRIELPADPSPAQRFLRISEIMFHPSDAAGEDAEFVELANVGTEPLDLAGVRFTRGISYEFPGGTTLAPGARLVVAKDPAAFASVYPSGPSVLGPWSGNLSNAGEALRLEDADGEVILEFTYPADSRPLADGLGYAIVPVDLSAPWTAWADPNQWRTGTRVNGTPGLAETLPEVPPVVVNEVISRSDPPFVDAVELHNPTALPADISGWWLTDDADVPAKFRIPQGSVIPPRGYLVFDASDWNAAPGGAFNLSAAGEEVYLFSASASGGLTGYSDGFEFQGSPVNTSFGRHTNSLGQVTFPIQREVTLGGVNAGPAVGPLVLSEICARPGHGEIPFIELKNISPAPLALVDPESGTRRWRVAGVDFDLPEMVLPPGGLVLVVGGDPVEFARRHRITPAAHLVVLGPFIEGLQEDGGRIAVECPGPDDSWIVIDEVTIDHLCGWPRAFASRPSLERHPLDAYANDPAHWRIVEDGPTPGWDSSGNRPPIVQAGAPVFAEASAYPMFIALEGSVRDDGLPEGILELIWSQVSGPAPVEFEDPVRTNTVVALPGPGEYILRLSANDGDATGSADLAMVISRPDGPRSLVPAGSTWRYFATGTMPPGGWRARDFNDSGWPSGAAELGYGDGDERTLLPATVQGGRLITAYFRHAFEVPAPGELRNLRVRLRRDDGAAVWLNGSEAWRDALPPGPLTYSTLATATVSGADESTFFERALPVSMLREGTNVLAVEVHQASASSSDLSFDLELVAERVSVNRPPELSLPAEVTVAAGEPFRIVPDWSDDGLARPAAFAWTQSEGPAAISFSATNVVAPTIVLPVTGTYRARVEVSDGEYSRTGEIAFHALQGEAGYEEWKALHFSASERNDPGISGEQADPDGDGHSNLDEFRAGTDPRDAASVLKLDVEMTGDRQIRFRVHAVRERTYAIEWREDVTNGEWQVLQVIPAPAVDGVVEVSDPAGTLSAGPRFYRVVTPAPEL